MFFISSKVFKRISFQLLFFHYSMLWPNYDPKVVLLSTKKKKQQRKNYFWEYATVGQRRYIDAEGRIISEISRTLDAQRIREIEAKTLLRLSAFRKAHCSACPSSSCQGGYFRALAPEICGKIHPSDKDTNEKKKKGNTASDFDNDDEDEDSYAVNSMGSTNTIVKAIDDNHYDDDNDADAESTMVPSAPNRWSMNPLDHNITVGQGYAMMAQAEYWKEQNNNYNNRNDTMPATAVDAAVSSSSFSATPVPSTKAIVFHIMDVTTGVLATPETVFIPIEAEYDTPLMDVLRMVVPVPPRLVANKIHDDHDGDADDSTIINQTIIESIKLVLPKKEEEEEIPNIPINLNRHATILTVRDLFQFDGVGNCLTINITLKS